MEDGEEETAGEEVEFRRKDGTTVRTIAVATSTRARLGRKLDKEDIALLSDPDAAAARGWMRRSRRTTKREGGEPTGRVCGEGSRM